MQATLKPSTQWTITMPLTLGMTGMDPATEADLKTAFEAANARLGGRWQLLPEG